MTALLRVPPTRLLHVYPETRLHCPGATREQVAAYHDAHARATVEALAQELGEHAPDLLAVLRQPWATEAWGRQRD